MLQPVKPKCGCKQHQERQRWEIDTLYRNCLCPCAAVATLKDENWPSVTWNTFFRGEQEGSASFIIKTSPRLLQRVAASALAPGHAPVSGRYSAYLSSCYCLQRLDDLPSTLLWSGLFLLPSHPGCLAKVGWGGSCCVCHSLLPSARPGGPKVHIISSFGHWLRASI